MEQQIIFRNNLNEKREKVQAEITAYEKKTAEFITGIKDLYLDKVKGVISESEFLQFSRTSIKKKNGWKC